MFKVGDKVITIDGFVGQITEKVTDVFKGLYWVKGNHLNGAAYYDYQLSKVLEMSYVARAVASESTPIKFDISGENGCEHKWTTYEGLMQKFDYCTKCDEKKK